MAQLPDIDTTNVSFLAYWNATNHGVDNIAPSDVTNDSSVATVEVYGNGLQGDYTLPDGNVARYRVKEDGWFVVWMDRSEAFTTESTSLDESVYGPWSMVSAWEDDYSPPSGSPLELDKAIESLQSQLSNSGSITLDYSDIGLYNYEYNTSTALTVLGAANTDLGATSHGLSYTSGTTINWAVGFGSANVSDGYDQEDISDATFEGLQLVHVVQSGEQWGSGDLLANDLISNSGTEYTLDLSGNQYGSVSAGFAIAWE